MGRIFSLVVIMGGVVFFAIFLSPSVWPQKLGCRLIKWNLHKNPTYGFSIKYPEGWEIKEFYSNPTRHIPNQRLLMRISSQSKGEITLYVHYHTKSVYEFKDKNQQIVWFNGHRAIHTKDAVVEELTFEKPLSSFFIQFRLSKFLPDQKIVGEDFLTCNRWTLDEIAQSISLY